MLCASEFGEWCRAVIESCIASSDHQNFVVRLLDYGCKAAIHRNDMQPIPFCLISIPAQATACTLSGTYTCFGDEKQELISQIEDDEK
jgi:Tudor domain